MNATNLKSRYLTFTLGDEEYALPLRKIKEVIGVPEITPIPFAPPYFMGIMNLRGQVISIIDLRLKFQMPKSQVTNESTVIIVELENVFLGLIVDTTNKVLNLTDQEIGEAPRFFERETGACIIGVAKSDAKLILILDILKTLDVNDIVVIKQQKVA